jgi:hypothetical protein
MQLLLGLYFSEILCVGLFALKGAYIPVVLMVILVVVTGLVHTSLIDALGPLLWSLPKSLTKEEDQHLLGSRPTNGYAANREDAEQFQQPLDYMQEGPEHEDAEQFQQPLDYLQEEPEHESGASRAFEGAGGAFNAANREDAEQFRQPLDYMQEEPEHESGASRAFEGAGGAFNALGGGIKNLLSKKVKQEAPEANVALDALAGFWRRWISPDPSQKSNTLLRWLHPEVYSDYTVLRRMVPSDLPDPVYPEDVERDIYYAPSFMMKPPTLWIPKDPGGISRQEVEHCEKALPATDEYVSIDENGHMKINLGEPRLVFNIDRLRY